jgi:hypothetical protein
MIHIRNHRGLRAFIVLLAFGACGATASAATDRATGLPLYAGTTQPMDASDPDFCGSAKTGMNYTLNTNAPDVLGWYKGKLRGFRYEHVNLPDGHNFEAFVIERRQANRRNISGDRRRKSQVFRQPALLRIEARRRSEQADRGTQKRASVFVVPAASGP